MSQSDYQVSGKSTTAPFTLKIHRGDGMALLAMNWKNGRKPPKDFVGFAIEYREPGGTKFFPLSNRINFRTPDGKVDAVRKSSLLSPFQKFRWVHFPKDPEKKGLYTYRVTPVHMDSSGKLSYGKVQQASLRLQRDTLPGKMNIAFTRGFVSSQAFAERYCATDEEVNTLIPRSSKEGIRFVPTHPKCEEALEWMGFEARKVIMEVLDDAIKDTTAKVCVIAYDLSEAGIVNKLVKLGNRLKVIIDDDGDHKERGSGENQAEELLKASAGDANVKRQHMGTLQHNKMIIVDGKKKIAIGGSTNYSWRGLFVQSNNAVIVEGKTAIAPFLDAFKNYWNIKNEVAKFSVSDSAKWCDLKLKGVRASVSFSPHNTSNAVLDSIARDLDNTKANLFFSLAFLSITPGAIKEAIKKIRKDDTVFCYGLADKKVGGLDLTKPDGKVSVVQPQALKKNVPKAFKQEVTGGSGVRMHHKFLVIDFNKPTARVYTGSYNFSKAADGKNGENLWLIKDRCIATSYAVASLAMFDHYHFRVLQEQAKHAKKEIVLKRPPADKREKAWWEEDYTNKRKILDRKLFA